MSGNEILVGAVAYHPRVVGVWERFRTYFAEAGIPTDYVLYSNYERLVEAFLAGDVQIAWNTNTAYVAAEHRVGGGTQLLGMRDVDRDYRTVIVQRRGEAVESLAGLAGSRLAVGSSDCGHSTILPIHYLGQEGVAVHNGTTLLRYEGDPGKHGDTGGPELRLLEAVAGGEADAGAVADVIWARLRSEGDPVVSGLELAWRSPTYYHCNFTALPDFDPEVAARWTEALLAMDYADPSLRTAMDLEGVKKWHPADKDGYAELAEAMAAQGYL
jgi:ABC-type phosphate/phosphonate transport system substrate-binding protein